MVERRARKRAGRAARAKRKRNTHAAAAKRRERRRRFASFLLIERPKNKLVQTHVTETAPARDERRGVEETDRAALEKDREQDMVFFSKEQARSFLFSFSFSFFVERRREVEAEDFFFLFARLAL